MSFISNLLNMKKLLRYPTLLFLILSATMLCGMHNGHKEDRCELRGFFGITHDEPSKQKLASLGYDIKGGTIVTNVVGCTAALNAGIQPMDYLYSINGKSANEATEFFCLMSDFAPGETFTVGLLRAGKAKTVKLTLGRRADACQQETPFPKRGFFGINDANSDKKPGVLIDVSSGGPVAELGIRDGDRLLRINGYQIADWHDLSVVKRLITDTDNVSFDLIRDGEDVNITGSIPEQEHQFNQWTMDKSVLDECAIEIERAISDINFDEIEREIESAIRSSDIREETENAMDEAMEAVREALNGLRSRGGNWNDDNGFGSSSSNVDPSDMDAKVEQLSAGDFSDMEELDVDMPKNRNLKVDDFSASPNPNQGKFRLSFNLPSAGQTRIAIYSATGREVYGYDLGEYSGPFTDELDIMRNGPGTYFLVVRQDDKAFVRKLILVKR